MTPRLALIFLLAASLQTACDSGSADKGAKLEAHAKIAVDGPLTAALTVCPEGKCPVDSPTWNEIEYVPDASGKIKAILLRAPAPDPPSVQASKELYERIRSQVQGGIGKGESFLESGDPMYWPGKLRAERVVTLTIDNSERTVLAVGPAGPDATKIPATGAANNRAKVQEYWGRIVATPIFQ